jgi:hypothetical protein
MPAVERHAADAASGGTRPAKQRPGKSRRSRLVGLAATSAPTEPQTAAEATPQEVAPGVPLTGDGTPAPARGQLPLTNRADSFPTKIVPARTRAPLISQADSPAEPATGPTEEAVILATAIFVTGTARLEPGRRYGFAITDSSLRLAGPTDVDPDALVMERPLAGLEAHALEGRLVLTEPGSRSGLVLAFMSVSGTTTTMLAETINRAPGKPDAAEVR